MVKIRKKKSKRIKNGKRLKKGINTRKIVITIGIHPRQFKQLNSLINDEVYESRSEAVRQAIDFWLNREYTRALIKHKTIKDITSRIKGEA